jgi:Bifunctional DNA primase/polymerase, N-terminal
MGAPLAHAYRQALETGDADELARIERLFDFADELERRPPDLGTAALQYAVSGVAVFPCVPRGKTPLISKEDGGRGLYDATTDPLIVADWWLSHPRANIGAATGHRFDVIDCDGPAGVRTVFWGDPAPFDELDVLGVALTPNGIHIYQPPQGHGNRTDFLEGVDYRGRGGYVIVPPSVGQSRGYHWSRPLRLEET